jgi:hypothetical protein
VTFDPTSRYTGLPTTAFDILDANGNSRRIMYVRRRFIPTADPRAAVILHRVAPGERLDNVTARYAEPTDFWRLCDASGVMRPEELDVPGAVIYVPLQGS